MRRAALLVVAAARQASGPLARSLDVPAQSPALYLTASAIRSLLSNAQARWSHCSCSGDLSLPPPQKVMVEYAPAEVDTFIAFADAVEEEFEGVMVDGVEVDGHPAAFDIRLEDGSTIYSRAAEAEAAPGGELPAYADLFDRLRAAGLQAAA
ncbi:hypothetical protein ABPG77_010906 [Micractinium sp. CCAP 211/92]